MTTRTLLAAPDGTAATRRTVGVCERVELTASAASSWSWTAGAMTPATGTVVTWTAPDAPGAVTITATPSGATVSACSVALTTIKPSRRVLTPQTLRAYDATKAGSGFEATVQIMPTNVSFSGIEVREETVRSTATGYYKDVLRWDGIPHPQTKSWLAIDATNGGMIDGVGTPVPGSSGPFSSGTFTWPIPQTYHAAGTTDPPINYSTGTHAQVMADATGAETTDKESGHNARTPAPPARPAAPTHP